MGRAKVISKRRKQKKQPDLLRDTIMLFETGLNMVVGFYMLLIIVVMPFYFTDGYANIGTDKHDFLYKVSGSVGIVFGALLMIYCGLWIGAWIRDKRYKQWKIKVFWNSLSWTDRFAIAYGMVVLLSYLFSDYQEPGSLGDAWLGAKRWYMGALTQFLLLAVYFAVSRFWKQNKWMPAMWIPVTTVLFVLGYLNRFRVYPIEMRNATKDFISTIGNINWYCAYLVIVFFGMLYYIWTRTEAKKEFFFVFWSWMILGFGALVSQGSLSGLVTLAVLMIVLYFFSMKDCEKLLMFMGCVVCLGVACAITCSWRCFNPTLYSFEKDIVDIVTYSPLAFVLPIAAFLLLFLLKDQQKKNRFSTPIFVRVGYIGAGVAVTAFVAFVSLLVINTLYPGSIGRLSKLAIFTFDAKWGTLRGTNWRAAWMCFTGQNLGGKLLGVGPDCMAMYIYSGTDSKLLELVNKSYPKMRLTNAHCEWLTVLVNTGILGLITYAGMMLSFITRCLKTRKQAPIIGACGFAVLAYTINNLFSFQQSMGVATLFIVLGMGEAYLRDRYKGASV